MKKTKLVALLIFCVMNLFLSCTQAFSPYSSNNKKSSNDRFETIDAKENDLDSYNFFFRYNNGNQVVKLSDAGYVDITRSNGMRSLYSAKQDKNLLYNNRIIGNPYLENKSAIIINSVSKKNQSSRKANFTKSKKTIINPTIYNDSNVNTTTTQFWTYKEYGSNDFEKRDFTLKAFGKHCLVWVENTCIEKITDDKITKIQEGFDKLYDVETDIFGSATDYSVINSYEFITEISDKVNIVFQEIDNNGISGFFSAKDYFSQKAIDEISKKEPEIAGMKSNETQILYMNYEYLLEDINFALSTVAHEFQHLLNFIHDCVSLGEVTETWYTEMLSVLAQDIFHEMISPEISEPFDRLTFFRTFPNYGITYWTDQPYIVDAKSMISYSVNYAFGAFLFRNYGGADLLRAMTSHENGVVNINAIDYALRKIHPGKNYTFENLARKFHQIFLTTSINGNLEEYKDIVTLNREIEFEAGSKENKQKLKANAIDLVNLPSCTFSTSPISSPYGLNEIDVIYPYGFTFSALPELKTVTYAKPHNSNILFYFY